MTTHSLKKFFAPFILVLSLCGNARASSDPLAGDFKCAAVQGQSGVWQAFRLCDDAVNSLEIEMSAYADRHDIDHNRIAMEAFDQLRQRKDNLILLRDRLGAFWLMKGICLPLDFVYTNNVARFLIQADGRYLQARFLACVADKKPTFQYQNSQYSTRTGRWIRNL